MTFRPRLAATDLDADWEWSDDDEFQPPVALTGEDDTEGGCQIVGPEGDEE